MPGTYQSVGDQIGRSDYSGRADEPAGHGQADAAGALVRVTLDVGCRLGVGRGWVPSGVFADDPGIFERHRRPADDLVFDGAVDFDVRHRIAVCAGLEPADNRCWLGSLSRGKLLQYFVHPSDLHVHQPYRVISYLFAYDS